MKQTIRSLRQHSQFQGALLCQNRITPVYICEQHRHRMAV